MKLNKAQMKSVYRVGLLWACMIVAACSSHRGLERFGNLEARVQEYYALEKSGEWQKAYYFRTPAFRRTVSLENYVGQMTKDSSGWRLEKYSVIGANEENGKVQVTIKFSEAAPISTVPADLRKDLRSSTIATERTENSVWMQIGDEWFCYDAVSRSHLSLNEPLVAE